MPRFFHAVVMTFLLIMAVPLSLGADVGYNEMLPVERDVGLTALAPDTSASCIAIGGHKGHPVVPPVDEPNYCRSFDGEVCVSGRHHDPG